MKASSASGVCPKVILFNVTCFRQTLFLSCSWQQISVYVVLVKYYSTEIIWTIRLLLKPNFSILYIIHFITWKIISMKSQPIWGFLLCLSSFIWACQPLAAILENPFLANSICVCKGDIIIYLMLYQDLTKRQNLDQNSEADIF